MSRTSECPAPDVMSEAETAGLAVRYLDLMQHNLAMLGAECGAPSPDHVAGVVEGWFRAFKSIR